MIFGGNGDDTIFGNGGRDYINGGNGSDILDGGADSDYLSGHRGQDELYGGAGNDWLNGGSGNDVLLGGRGNDFMYGGSGDNRFVIEADGGHDRIFKFDPGDDKLDLSFAGFQNFRELSQHMHEDEHENTHIDLGDGQSVLLIGVEEDDLDAGDFIL